MLGKVCLKVGHGAQHGAEPKKLVNLLDIALISLKLPQGSPRTSI